MIFAQSSERSMSLRHSSFVQIDKPSHERSWNICMNASRCSKWELSKLYWLLTEPRATKNHRQFVKTTSILPQITDNQYNALTFPLNSGATFLKTSTTVSNFSDFLLTKRRLWNLMSPPKILGATSWENSITSGSLLALMNSVMESAVKDSVKSTLPSSN